MLEKIGKRISSLLILFTIGASYTIWLLGIYHPLIIPWFSHSAYYIGGVALLVLALNWRKLQLFDVFWLLLALGDTVLNLFTAEFRHAETFDMSILPAVILLFVLACKINGFDQLDRVLLLGINLGILALMLYRLFKHLFNSGLISRFFSLDNTLEVIWINVNVIGAVILFAVVTGSILLRSFHKKVLNLLVWPLYLVGLAGTWGCQSRTSFLILLSFILVDNLLPKSFFGQHKFWLWLFPLFFILTPFVSYFIAQSETINIFTGRENIWRAFFGEWLTSKQAILAGRPPFLYSAKLLSTHNSYLYLLCNFGVIGYTFLFAAFSGYLLRLKNKVKTLSRYQVSLLFAFFLTLFYGLMEDSLLVIQWTPILFAFLGLALSGEAEVSQE